MSDSDITSLASRKLKFQVVFSGMVVGGALLMTWLFPDIGRITAVIPLIFSAIISGNPHSPPMAIFILALIIQWSVLGYLLSIPMSKLWTRLK
jgi:hypothetical protein